MKFLSVTRRYAVLGTLLLAATTVWGADESKKDQERADVQKTAQETLDQLYAAEPAARKAVTGAAGYAVFSNFGMKILVAGGGSGNGLAVNNKSKTTTYMKMKEIQAGLGFGVKKFRV